MFKKHILLPLIAASSAAVLVLAGCGGPAARDSGNLELVIQNSSGPSEPSGVAVEDFAKAVEDESDGHITVTTYHSNSLVPYDEVLESFNAGLLDIASVVAPYFPNELPRANLLTGLSHWAPASPKVGVLASAGGVADAFKTPELREEARDAGMEPLVPSNLTFPQYQLSCAHGPATTLEEMKGTTVRSGSAVHDQLSRKLGMQPTSMAVGEVYESLQRGAVDCDLSDITTLRTQGTAEVVSDVMIDSEVPVHGGVNPWMIGKNKWETMTTDQQHIVQEAANKYLLGEAYEKRFADSVAVLNDAQDRGIKFHEYDDDVRKTMNSFYDSHLQDVKDEADRLGIKNSDAWVDEIVEDQANWAEQVDDADPSYTGSESWTDLVGADKDHRTLDMEPFLELYREQITDSLHDK